MYQIYFYVPEKDKEKVKQAMFEAGGGEIGTYSHCSFEFKGEGQYLPNQGSNPTYGNVDSLNFIEEYKVEMVCEKDKVREVLKAMKESHPYEEPAYGIFEILKIDF